MSHDTIRTNRMVSTSSTGVVRIRKMLGKCAIMPESQLFPARDGSWLMVDWIDLGEGEWFWYVCEGVLE